MHPLSHGRTFLHLHSDRDLGTERPHVWIQKLQTPSQAGSTVWGGTVNPGATTPCPVTEVCSHAQNLNSVHLSNADVATGVCVCVGGLAVQFMCVSQGETTPHSAMGIISHPHRKQHALGHSPWCCWMHPHVLQRRARTRRTDVYSHTHASSFSSGGGKQREGGCRPLCSVIEAQQVGDAGTKKYKTWWTRKDLGRR